MIHLPQSYDNKPAPLDAELKADAPSPDLWIERARTLARLDRTQAAKEAYNRALELDPENFDALNELGALLYATGHPIAASAAYAKAAAHNPDGMARLLPELRDVFVIGGESGSGKTTLAMLLLPALLGIKNFVSSDAIAMGLNPIRPDTAKPDADYVMTRYLRKLTKTGASFAFESTCVNSHHIRALTRCKQAGYFFTLIYLWLPSAEIALERVKVRVEQAQIPLANYNQLASSIRNRYAAGISNMVNLYLPLADAAFVIDASDIILNQKNIIAEKYPGHPVAIHNPILWNQILASCGTAEANENR